MSKSPETDLESLLDAWRRAQIAAHRSERTIIERAQTIRFLAAFTGEHPLKFTAEGIERFIARPGLKRNSRATYHAAIRAYSAWLVRTDRRRTDPTQRTEAPKRDASVPRPISEAQLRRVLAVCNRRRTRMMVIMGAFAGLRVHEIAKLRGEDLELGTGALTVVGKGGSTKLIALDDALLDEAADWPRADWWFPSYTSPGEPITGRGVSQAISSALQRAEVRATPHQLRHFYGTTLLAGGANLRVVQELMRHKSVASTQIYTDITFAQQREALRGLHARDILAAAA